MTRFSFTKWHPHSLRITVSDSSMKLGAWRILKGLSSLTHCMHPPALQLCFVYALPHLPHLPPPMHFFSLQGLQLVQAVADVAEREEGEENQGEQQQQQQQQQSHHGQGAAEQSSGAPQSLQEHSEGQCVHSSTRRNSEGAGCAVRAMVGSEGRLEVPVGNHDDRSAVEMMHVLEMMAGVLGDELDALHGSDSAAE